MGRGIIQSALLLAASGFAKAASSIDYHLTYVGTETGGPDSMVFSTALESSTSVLSHFTNSTECRTSCSSNSECLGYVKFRDSDCVSLRELGEPVETNLTSLSFTKFTSYDERDSHSIQGFYWYSNAQYAQGTTHTVYVDLNHNGEHDAGEPINTTTNNNFMLSNIPSGNYLVREIQTDTCTQLWPGVWGDNEIVADGSTVTYVDSVVQYYHDGHPTQIEFEGGIITDTATETSTPVSNAPFSYITGDSVSEFLSFHPGYGIVMAFLDEVVTNGEGNDLIIETFGNSTTNAHVSISQNNIDYYQIGILTNENNKFDLGNVTEHAAYVKLHFFGDNYEDVRNVVSVYGVSIDSAYRPPYAIHVSVPQDDLIMFVKDCNYYYHCYTYCVYTRVTYDTIDSCMVGCDLWEAAGTCDCVNYNETGVDVPFYGEIFHPDQCMDGCEYKIQHEVYPDYRLKMNASGRPNRITSSVNCDEYDVSGLSPNGCIMDAIDSCTRQPSCEAVSLDNHVHGYLYDDFHYVDEENSYILVKNSDDRNRSLVRFTTPTTTPTTSPTTTQTTSPTTTQTTSPTTTQTTSPTTTPTTSPTTTPTTSPTTTQTTSPTTTQTTSPTTTQTTTPTTTQTTTQTTSPTTTQTTTVILEESANTAVRDGLLISLAVILAICLAALILYKKRKREAIDRQQAANNANGITELAPDHQPFSNPVYDTSLGRESVSPQHNTFLGNGNRSPTYLDVMPDYVEEVVPQSPGSGYMDVSSTIETETNV